MRLVTLVYKIKVYATMENKHIKLNIQKYFQNENVSLDTSYSNQRNTTCTGDNQHKNTYVSISNND